MLLRRSLRRRQVQDLLDEASHPRILHGFAMEDQELVIQELSVVRSVLGLLVQTLGDEIIEVFGEFSRR